jgi:hypothetical protein
VLGWARGKPSAVDCELNFAVLQSEHCFAAPECSSLSCPWGFAELLARSSPRAWLAGAFASDRAGPGGVRTLAVPLRSPRLHPPPRPLWARTLRREVGCTPGTEGLPPSCPYLRPPTLPCGGGSTVRAPVGVSGMGVGSVRGRDGSPSRRPPTQRCSARLEASDLGPWGLRTKRLCFRLSTFDFQPGGRPGLSAVSCRLSAVSFDFEPSTFDCVAGWSGDPTRATTSLPRPT